MEISGRGDSEVSVDFEQTDMNTTRVKPSIVALRMPTWIYVSVSAYYTVSLTTVLARNNSLRAKRQVHRNNFGKGLNISRLFAAYFTTVLFLYHSFSSRVEEIPGIDCNWFKKSEIFLYWINISVIYGVLWLRQRAIYGKPTLRHLTSVATTIISYIVGVLIILLPVINGIITAITISFKHYDDEVCAFGNYTGDETLVTISEFIVPISLPLTLMGLFIWPLLQHALAGELQNANKDVMWVVRKVVFLTAGCLITDMGAMACNKLCDVHHSFIARQTSIFVNFVLLTFAFSDWKQVMLPCISNSTKNAARSTTVVRASWTQTYEFSIKGAKNSKSSNRIQIL